MKTIRHTRRWTLLAAVLAGLIGSVFGLLIAPQKAAAAFPGAWQWQGDSIISRDMLDGAEDFVDIQDIVLTKSGDKYRAEPRWYCVGKSRSDIMWGKLVVEITPTSGSSGSLFLTVADCPGQQPDGQTYPNIAITGTPPAGGPSGPAPTEGSVTGQISLTDETRDDIEDKLLTNYFYPD